MNKLMAWTLSLSVAVAGMGLGAHEAEAKRLGSGRPAGMQRQMPADAPKPNTPAQPAQGAQPGAQQAPAAAPVGAAAPAAAAAAGKRSWLGPIAGIAAGLGIAALFSHLGWGEGLANVLTMALLAVAAVVLVRWLMRRMAAGRGQPAGAQLAGAGAGAGMGGTALGRMAEPLAGTSPAAGMSRTPLAPVGSATPAASATPYATGGASAALPDNMDPAEFTRIAKQVFIRLQAANDAADVEDLRRFTTPELFSALKADLLERGNARQQTDVVQLDAEVADVAHEQGRDIVSVRFSGLIREQADAGAERFAELWHLVRPSAGGDWAIAGITPLA